MYGIANPLEDRVLGRREVSVGVEARIATTATEVRPALTVETPPPDAQGAA
jgi:hypothetical protein